MSPGIDASIQLSQRGEEIIRRLKKLPTKIRDRTSGDIIAKSAILIHREMTDSFNAQTAPYGVQFWKDITAKWRLRKAREGRSTDVGIYKGNMRQSRSMDIRARLNTASVGYATFYAPFFSKLRELLPPSVRAVTEMQEVASDALDRVIREI